MHQFQPEATHKIHWQQQKHRAERYPPMEDLSNDHKNHPNQHKNSLKLCNEMGHPILNLMESQWKLRQQYDEKFPMEAKPW